MRLQHSLSDGGAEEKEVGATRYTHAALGTPLGTCSRSSFARPPLCAPSPSPLPRPRRPVPQVALQLLHADETLAEAHTLVQWRVVRHDAALGPIRVLRAHADHPSAALCRALVAASTIPL
eukprot:331390-Prymnesium_polylepis.1